MIHTKFALFDLDGCLANDMQRRHKLPPTGSTADKYDRYHEAAFSDKACNPGARLLSEALRTGLSPLFITGRPDKFREQTVEWIVDAFGISNPIVLMRPKGLDIESPALKIQLLQTHGFSAEQFEMAVDDRDDVLSAYRRYGIREVVLFKATFGYCDQYRDPEEPPHSPADYLSEGAEVFKRGGGAYKDAYLVYGDVMAALFPEGLNVRTVEDWQRLGVFNQIMTKVTRYAMTLESGGHADSALDISVYGAMLRSITTEEK